MSAEPFLSSFFILSQPSNRHPYKIQAEARNIQRTFRTEQIISNTVPL